jgi:energy-coupling factor transport system ATP-binding protein
MSLVQLEHVRYRYPDASAYALDDIHLNISAGEYVLLAGASGSGKSTFCRLLDGLIPHFYVGSLDGSVLVEGVDTRARPVHEWFARVGLVFQNPDAQLFNSTVAREIAFGLESLGLPRGEIRERIEWTLQAVQIEPLRDRPPHSLSGGEQQLVAIAAMLALRPRVLVLDEPFANLDPAAIARVRALLRDIHEQGTTLVLAEHRLHATLQDATRLIVLDRGHVAKDGAPREVLAEDVAGYRLNVPFVVKLAHSSGWRHIPLSVDEAVELARKEDHLLLPDRRNGAHAAPADASQVVEARDLSFVREGRAILQDIQFELKRGECAALVGKNGSGKTTLLKHLNGLYRPTAGSLRVLGQDVTRARVSDLARQVGLVFQNPNDQLFKPNVREEIEVAPRALKRMEPAWIDKLIGMFELMPLLERSPFTLSEGEKKRVAFAATLAAHPAIVALDEPTTGQDAAFRSALARLMRELQSEGMTILLATHDMEFAELVASRWLVLADGRIIAQGAPDEVMHNADAMQRAALRPTARFRVMQALAARGGEPSVGDVVESRG